MRKQKGYHSETQLIHLSIWMIGLGIFFLFGHVWPGVFILIGISMLIESLSRGAEEPGDKQSLDDLETYRESPAQENREPEVPQPESLYSSSEEQSESIYSHLNDLLPERCPWCGAPVHGSEIQWQGNDRASCTFCGADLIDGGQ